MIPFSVRNNPRHKRRALLTLLVLVSVVVAANFADLRASGSETITALIGPGDSIMVAAPDGRIVLAKHER